MSSSGDSSLLTFINGDTSGENPIVDAANPVNWSRLAKAIGTSVIATVVAGVTDFISAGADAFVSIVGGFGGFIEGWEEPLGAGGRPTVDSPGFIELTLGAVGSAYSGAFQFSTANFGVFSLPINVAIVLGSVYILSVGLRAAASRFVGGG
ncbi:hypothetical protein [Halorubrum distributum]|uniref:Uncharacterized protein n=1 Tax=Halorubrum distributum JCM 13916 TaxID=1230455 RepID=M0PPK4_9EURY|nr:hypothetical protein [Halorubrum arcis]EMA71953.1 hypothetical protein C462_04225 [Halorubrum arcis JCM 13916]